MKKSKKNFNDCFNKNISDFIESYKVENNSFVKKNNYDISINAILSENYYSQKSFEELNKPYGSHGLSFKNSKFFYDPYYNHKVSIYFDGDITFDNFNQNNCDNISINISEKFRESFKFRSSIKLNKKFECIASYYISRKDLFFKKPDFEDINEKYDFKIFDFENNKNVQYLIYNNNLNSFQICKPELYCQTISFKEGKRILTGSHSIYKDNDVQKLVLPVNENKANKMVNKILINTENAYLNTKNNSLNYIKFNRDIKNANLNITLNNNSKIFISNSELNILKLNINELDLSDEYNNSYYSCLTFLDTVVKNFKLNSMKNICNDKVKYVRSKVTYIN